MTGDNSKKPLLESNRVCFPLGLVATAIFSLLQMRIHHPYGWLGVALVALGAALIAIGNYYGWPTATSWILACLLWVSAGAVFIGNKFHNWHVTIAFIKENSAATSGPPQQPNQAATGTVVTPTQPAPKLPAKLKLTKVAKPPVTRPLCVGTPRQEMIPLRVLDPIDREPMVGPLGVNDQRALEQLTHKYGGSSINASIAVNDPGRSLAQSVTNSMRRGGATVRITPKAELGADIPDGISFDGVTIENQPAVMAVYQFFVSADLHIPIEKPAHVYSTGEMLSEDNSYRAFGIRIRMPYKPLTPPSTFYAQTSTLLAASESETGVPGSGITDTVCSEP